MNIKLKSVVIFESIIIILMVLLFLWFNVLNPPSVIQKYSYCNKYMYEDKTCLISPSISVGNNQPAGNLIFNFQPLKDNIQAFLNMNGLNSSVSVYVVNLRDTSSFGIGANDQYAAASLNKLPIAIIIFKKIEKGEFTLDTYLPIYDRDRDSLFGSLYTYSGNQMKIRDLLYYMLAQSDNTAARVLSEEITINDLQGFSSYLDLYTQDINAT
ncbi:MAG TPA: serine hydrolase, partial [Candidatus Omnitrophota bacterium]|nr:serine hydrolase [Candidatus Omnitrophota bacterium]